MAKRSERTVLFLFTGNYYRSRFAEVLFNSVAGGMGLPWRASSTGLALERGWACLSERFNKAHWGQAGKSHS